MATPRIFLSYSHKDAKFLESLKTHLRVSEGLLAIWDDQRIAAGSNWPEEIRKAIDETQVALLLISADFLTSQFILSEEIPLLLAGRERGLRVVPILVRGCDWQNVPWLKDLQVLPRGARPLASMKKPQRETEMAAITCEVRQLFDLGAPSADPWSTRTISNAGSTPNQALERSLSEQAASELATLRLQSSVSLPEARRAARDLAERILTGDLHLADRSTKAQVLRVAARLNASSTETLDDAKHLRTELLRLDPATSTAVIDALILDTEGEFDKALQMLRDLREPEAQDVFFAILVNRRSEAVALSWFESQAPLHAPEFFTGRGWFNLAVVLAHAERWENASEYLAGAAQYRTDHPDLWYLEGVANAALTLRSDLRYLTLLTNLPPPHVLEGAAADRNRKQAISCFKGAQEALRSFNPGRAEVAREWVLWLRLTAPEEREAARQEVRRELENLEKGISLLPLAEMFHIPFDADRYWARLGFREQVGGLSNQELYARFVLAKVRLKPREFFDFLETEEARLSSILPPDSLISEKIRALLLDNRTAAARQLLEENKDLFHEDERERITLNLEASEGNDPRVHLEDLYARTKSNLDLQNLAAYLFEAKDWAALVPLQKELFRVESNLPNFLRLVVSMEHDPEVDDKELLALLQSNSELVSWNHDLLAAEARILLHLGRLGEARELSDKLILARDSPNDLELDIDLALLTGNWERFSGIIEREWPRREQLSAGVLIRLATMASDVDRQPGRAVELLKLAAQKGINNPHILMAAFVLMHQLGREGEETTEWISQALALSAPEGPVTRVELRRVVEEILPRQREQAENAQEAWLKGEIPIHFASEYLNTPISFLLLDLPRRNAQQQDGRLRSVIPIASGGRQAVETQPGWRVAFDITSLMVLYRLGVLKEVLDSSLEIRVPPDTMPILLNEKKRIQFQQPSRVRMAEEINRLIETGILKVAENLPAPPAELAEEIGHDLASLLAAARQEDSCVVRPRPVDKLRSFSTELAELGDYDSLILSTLEFAEALFQAGKLDKETYERSSLYLRTQDQGPSSQSPSVGLAGPVYLDDLALTYLQQAGLMPALERSGLDLRIHTSVKKEQFALISSAQEREKLADEIDELRTMLRDAMAAEHIGFLPWHRPTAEEERLYRHAPTLGQLLRDVGDCDAASLDDRYLQGTGSRIVDSSGRMIPVLSVLDLLNHLERQGSLSREQRLSKLHRLREGGFAFVPVDPDELARYLPTQIREDTLIESPELRLIRQTLGRIRSLGIVSPADAAFLGQLNLASIIAIRQFWADETIPAQTAVQFSKWIWQNVAPSPPDWLKAEPEGSTRLQAALLHHLSLLLGPQAIGQERLEEFMDWAEEDVLRPLLAANAPIVDQLATQMAQQIESWSRNIGEQEDESPTRG